jgi:phenylpropionate dioxygenase-like ring-hydroxylating dioxygenase large terminal subunit
MFSYKHDLPANVLLNYPRLTYNELTEQDKYDLQWYVVGKSSDFVKNKPYKARIWNKNYVVWKNSDGNFTALDDVCSHKGASLSAGKVINNNIMCPYHGYEFNCNGTLTHVPGICFHPSPVYDLPKYDIVDKNGWVYINTMKHPHGINVTELEEQIFVEPEIEQNFSVVHLDMNYNCYSRVLSENSLDIMHIAFVHTFGNAKRPNPIKEEPPKLVGRHHYKSRYYYEAGEDSMARKVFGAKDLIVENEFILPHTTVARIIFGDFVSTVITFALPIGENKSKLFVKTYRNFWQNNFGDMITKNTMYNTMIQDKVVVENIDSRFMDGKFNMRFDKLQNTYKSFYKKFIHTFSNDGNNFIMNEKERLNEEHLNKASVEEVADNKQPSSNE